MRPTSYGVPPSSTSRRTSAVIRGGGWDDYLRYHNEHSLFLRLQKRMRAGEYLVYDPDAKMKIRKDVPGGLNYRVDGEVVGTVGVIGPTRMAYDRVVPIVDITARLLSSALSQH